MDRLKVGLLNIKLSCEESQEQEKADKYKKILQGLDKSMSLDFSEASINSSKRICALLTQVIGEFIKEKEE